MSSNLLSLVQTITSELGLPSPNVVISNPDTQIQQIFSFLNRLGRDLTRDYDWQELETQHVFQTQAFSTSGVWTQDSAVVTGIPDTSGLSTDWNLSSDGFQSFSQIISIDSATQVTLNQPADESGSGVISASKARYTLPSDWKNEVAQTEWDRTQHWPIGGPVTPQQAAFLKGGIVSSGPWMRFRITGSRLELIPNPPDESTVSLEYISNAWVIPASGANKSGFTVDTDTCIYDDSLMILGTKMLWRQEKGFESSIVERDYRNLLEKTSGQNKSAPKLSMGPRPGTVLLGPWNILDGNWPS